MVVIDQMRADYFDRYGSQFRHGLKTLADNSSFHTNARTSNVPTETAPGHACIITGQSPSAHGIIANDWWDRKSGKIVHAADDPVYGVGPGRMLKTTVGDMLKAQSAKSRVVAVGGKDRSAVMMGGKNADAVLWFDKKKGRVVTSKAYGAPPAWLEGFNFEHPAPKSLIPSSDADRLLLELVKTTLREYQLGQDAAPDLLAVSFSATDAIGHTYGPDSDKILRHLLELDKILGELLTHLSAATQNDFAVVLTADHGVTPTSAKRVMLKNVAESFEKICQKLHPAPGKTWIKATLIPDVYFDKALLASKKIDWNQFLTQAAEEFKKVEGVAEVYLPETFTPADEYTELYKRSYSPGRSGDLLVRIKPGLLLTDKLFGTTHGSPYDDDARIPLLFYGKDFPAEKKAEPATYELAAPAVAQQLGIQYN